MPYRLLLYMVEIWRDVVMDLPKSLTARKSFRLPPIIPIVLYNGAHNWTACKRFKETLNDYKLFEDYLLDFEYILIDVNRYKKEDLLKEPNVIRSIFLLDQEYNTIEVMERLTTVQTILPRLDPNGRHVLVSWVDKIIIERMEPEMREKARANLFSQSEEADPVIVSNFAKAFKKYEEEFISEVVGLPVEEIVQIKVDLTP